MDLGSLLNSNPDRGVEKRSSTLPSEGSRRSVPLSTPSSAHSGSHPGGPYALPRNPPGQQTPLFAPPSGSQAQGRGLTPLQTPSQAPNGGQYPFPQQQAHPPLQSPASAQPGHSGYRSFEAQSATTPGPRPSSHGFPYAHPSPSMGQYHQAINAHGTASLSPTPSSHHSQTPHSVRQSPMATIGHPPPHSGQPLPPQHYHQSQPNTPLGPPQLPQRYSNGQVDVSSPQHSRTLSGASSGIVAGSPHNHGNIDSIVESPSLHNRPSPQMRRTSDYRSSMDRERSVSVSPKTMIPARSSSHGSRHSSQQEMYSAHSGRSSQQASTGMVSRSETPGHVQPQTANYAQPAHHSHQASEVSQVHSQHPSSSAGPPVNGNPLSQPDGKVPLQHHPQKMGMSHLLAPTQHVQQLSLPNGAPKHSTPSQTNGSRQSHEHSLPAAHHGATPPMQSQAQANSSQGEASALPISNGTPSRPSPNTSVNVMSRAPAVQIASKRAAESDLDAPPPKRRRRRPDRPVWAQLAPQNPRAKGLPRPVQQSQPVKDTKPPPSAQPSNPAPQPPPTTTQQDGWEKSIRNVEPLPSFTKALSDHLYTMLENNPDIGHDAQEGTIEIEAKIGTLVDLDTQSRYAPPALSAFVIHPRINRKFRFDSEMNEPEHRNINHFLNKEVKESHQDPNRVKIQYEHLRETDHFQTLSDVGMRALPVTAHRRQDKWGRDLRLRTSISNKDGRVTGRIVKIKLCDDLHIAGVGDPYDIRISVNLEVNLADRPDIDPNQIVNVGGPQLPTRKKDRLSYKHLAYEVDLTRVDSEGMPPKYELELEVDANEIQTQIQAMKQGRANRFTEVVEGFVSNMTWLMRIPRQG